VAFTVSLLAPERYSELEPIFEEYGGTLPNPDTSYVIVAEEDGEILAFWVVQAQVHIEPFWVSPAARGRSGLFAKQMIPHILAALKADGAEEFFAFAPDDAIFDYLARLGLEPLPWVVFRGQVPNTP
jgi:hypothetical protein